MKICKVFSTCIKPGFIQFGKICCVTDSFNARELPYSPENKQPENKATHPKIRKNS
jgi:hypothetical protein